MRYRSKKQRKQPLSASASLDGIENSTLNNKLVNKQKVYCDHRDDNCNCSSVQRELSTKLALKSGEDERGRSRSETRIADGFLNKHNVNNNSYDDLTTGHNSRAAYPKESDDQLNKTFTLGRTKEKLTEIKQYNTKTLPKRIANLKKQRSKTMKETFKFYMDLPTTPSTTNNDTVLRITESTDNLSVTDSSQTAVDKETTNQNIDEKNSKHDVEIISDLLKANKDFDRILKKPPKKKSFDNGKSSHEFLRDNSLLSETPPVPIVATDEFVKDPTPSIMPAEPIYESLLRNVHVPYKFSPILNRSISQQHYKFKKVVKKIENKRPESDYVTLLYSETGELKSVDGHVIKSLKDEVSLMRNSDSNINYNKMAALKFDEGISSGSSGNLERQNSFQAPSKDNQNLDQFKTRKSIDNANLKNVRMSDRRVSDVSEMYCQSIIHKQGSEAVGSRIAHLDYADPRTLFTTSQTNILINKNSVKQQRDSVFSLTSSSDSVYDTIKNQGHQIMMVKDCNDSFYEQSVEDSLENIAVFRDSAIYSDDNNDKKFENIYDVPTSPNANRTPPKVPKKPMRSPPPLPNNKPPTLSVFVEPNCNVHLREKVFRNETTTPSVSASIAENSKRSWVLQQIKNFDQ